MNHWLLTVFMAINLVFGHHWVHVPALIQHFEDHQAMEGKDMAFADFFALHYNGTGHSESEGSDHDLPFKHDHKEHIGIDHVIWSPVLTAHQNLHAVEVAVSLQDPDDLRDGFRRASLQPPKQA